MMCWGKGLSRLLVNLLNELFLLSLHPFLIRNKSLNAETRSTGTEFVIGPIWEVEEIRMAKHLFYSPIITKPK